jgi:Fe-Mn family superoxide dismutase
MSDRTMRFHHDKHHASCLRTLNGLLEGVDNPSPMLEGVLLGAMHSSDKTVFNNAAQAGNHSFFWTFYRTWWGADLRGR